MLRKFIIPLLLIIVITFFEGMIILIYDKLYPDDKVNLIIRFALYFITGTLVSLLSLVYRHKKDDN